MKDDKITGQKIFIDYAHHEVHEGNHYNLSYSVASVGGQTTPDDMMTLSFKTPPGDKKLHMVVAGICSSGARFRFIEGKTGGGATPTGTITANNTDRGSSNTSIITDVAGANAGKVSYDATLFTGGTTLVDEYIGADGAGLSFIGGESRGDEEWILAADTEYQLSIYETDTVPGTLQLSWYEHISLRN
jgi:hypothetical protein